MAGIIAKVRAELNRRVPLGYEDETGFHFGGIHFQNQSTQARAGQRPGQESEFHPGHNH